MFLGRDGRRLAARLAVLGLASSWGCTHPDEVAPGAGQGEGSTGEAPAPTGPASSGSSTTADSDAATTQDDPTAGDDSGAGSTGEPGLPPPYPIVLAHGFFGFEDFAGVGFIDYFWEVPQYLDEHGESMVFVTTVDPFNDSTTRGEQLLAQVEAIVDETGYAKVNIIGHSQGGLDARYVAHHRPDLVDAVATVATPHRGTPIADIVLGLVPDPGAQTVVDWLVQTLGAPLWPDIDSNTSLAASMEQLSEPGMDAFNAEITDQPSVTYYSIAGRSGGSDGGITCRSVDNPPPFIAQWADETDPIDPLFAPTEEILSGGLLSSIANDGLVVANDAKWGNFLGCVPADHIDQIGHLFGDRPGLLNDWDYKEFYADLVGYLRQQGH
jgi:triacylglycerol lipase